MVPIILNPNSLFVFKYNSLRPKLAELFVKNHNKYAYIEMLGLIKFLHISDFICHNGLFQHKFKLS